MQHWDVIVIGSGISSLTSAALLAKKGKAVLVLERYRKPGGYLHCFDRFGSTFDTGGHYVGGIDAGQPFRVLLEYLGAWDPEIFVALPRDGFDVFRFPSFTVEMCAGVEAAIERVCAVFPKERAGITKYYRLCADVARRFPTYQYNEEFSDMGVLASLETPLSKVVDELTDDPRLRTFLCSYCVLHGVLPKDTPFGFHAIMTDSLLRGPYGFREGGDRLARALVRAIENAGGKVMMRRRVDSLTVENQSVQRVRTNKGEEFTSEWVISGIHPKATFRLMADDAVKPAFRSRLAGIDETTGFMGIYAACKTEPPFNELKNYYLFRSDELSSYDEIMQPAATPTARPLALYLARNSRSRAANKRGFYPLTIHGPGAYGWFEKFKGSRFADRPAGYDDVKKQAAEYILNFADEAWPGLRASVVDYVTSSPLTNLFYNGSEDGSPYGIYHSIQNTGARALGPRTHIRNLLLTGQSCLFPGLLASSIAGLRTTGHILGIKPILNELRQNLEVKESPYS